jgi:hypothetical protein
MIRLPTLIDAVNPHLQDWTKIAPPEKPFSRSFAGCGPGRGRRPGQKICLNRLHLVRFQRVFERRHAAVFEIAAQHHGLELVMCFRGGIAQVRNAGA